MHLRSPWHQRLFRKFRQRARCDIGSGIDCRGGLAGRSRTRAEPTAGHGAQHRLAARRRGIQTRGDCAAVRQFRQLLEIAAGAGARAAARMARAAHRSTAMHPGLRELLMLRDGAPVPARIAEHAQDCEQCSAEIARLNELGTQLRRLPVFAPPARAWAAIEQALSTPEATRNVTGRARSGSHRGTAGGHTAVGVALAEQARAPIRQSPIDQSRFRQCRPESLSSLVARSQRLEALLRGLPRPAVERAATAAVIDELQARIQVLDVQLSGTEGSAPDRAQVQRLGPPAFSCSTRSSACATRSMPRAVTIGRQIPQERYRWTTIIRSTLPRRLRDS